MQNLIVQLQQVVATVKGGIPLALLLIASLWLILLLNKIVGYRLNLFGIIPRHAFGLVGIPLHPLLHGSFNHLFFNSVPLFVFLTFLIALGLNNFIYATVTIITLSGVITWLFARPGIHIGASGLVMGYFGYLLVFAYQFPSILSFLLAIICAYYFGSLILSIFPNEERVSWEGHLFGLVAGMITTFICPLIRQ